MCLHEWGYVHREARTNLDGLTRGRRFYAQLIEALVSRRLSRNHRSRGF